MARGSNSVKKEKRAAKHTHRCQACNLEVTHRSDRCVEAFGSSRFVVNGCRRCNKWTPEQWAAHEAKLRGVK
jgi:hypothetical protein